jgi:dihydropteroate synthase
MTTGPVWRAGKHTLDCSARTLVMGVLNVTPDSFSDGGRHFDPEVAVAAGIRMVADGADILDVGGESTRPGSEAVPAAEEIDRVVPVIKRLAAEINAPVSVDTRKHEVAEAALDAGADIVNDVSAGEHDPGMFDVVRSSGAGFVLMHMRGEPNTMTELTDYEDVVADVKEYLRRRIGAAVDAGIDWETLVVDPGLGFAMTTPQSLLLMKETATFLDLGRPLLVGPSRKSFIGHVLDTEVAERLEGTAGAVAYMVARGAHIVRVHDVKEMVRVVRVVDAITHAEPDEV